MSGKKVKKSAWRYRRDLANKLFYGLHAPLNCQLMYCTPSDVKCHTTYVREILPDHCATIPSQIAIKSKELKKKITRVIAGGDWDLHHMPIEDVLPYKLAIDKLSSGQTWEAVGEYERMEELIRIKGSNDHCRTRADIDRRYARMDRLIEDVQTDRRLKTRKELGRILFRELGGINIGIGRDGKIIKLQGGTHRLAIAVHFDIPALPVCVRIVHEDCVRSGKFRELMRKSATLETL